LGQFRTTADILDLALQKAGEVTNGNSPYETQVLNYLNRVHLTLVSGGSIPLGKDQTVEIDEVWPWSRARRPLILELQPKFDTGSLTVTLGSEGITFSSAPTVSVAGWYIKIQGRDEVLRVASHTASSTSAELDGLYPDASGSALSFVCVKLDYELTPDYIVIDATNNKLQFQEAAGVTQTATLTSGTYAPSDLATEVQTQLNATGGTPVYTVTYSAVTKRFTIASDRGGASVFVLVGTGSQSLFSAHKTLGFDDEDTTNAASVTSTYILGGIARLIEPMKRNKGHYREGSIFGCDSEAFQRTYPLPTIVEGYPDKFAVVQEREDGTLTVRFNRYPEDKTRIEVDHVPVPRDLKDSASSIPLVPRKHIDVLEDAAVFYLLLDKNDDRAQIYANLMQGKLKAMLAQHRGSLVRSGENFGQLIPRIEQLSRRRRLFNDDLD
jgi:hypothetical protein